MFRRIAALFSAIFFVNPAQALPACTSFFQSGSIAATSDGEVFQSVVIKANNGLAGLNYNGHSNVGLLNAVVYFCSSNAQGVYGNGGQGNWLVNVQLIDTCAAASGFNPSATFNSKNAVELDNSPYFYARNVQVVNVGTGFYLQNSSNAYLADISGTNLRGYSGNGGQLVQFASSNDGTLVDFYAYNDPNISRTEDIVNIYQSYHVAVSGGVVDGANSPTGSCAQVDQGSGNPAISGVDCLHALNQCFGAYGASGVYNVTYAYVRCRDMIAAANSPRGPASSGGVPFVGTAPGSNGAYAEFLNAVYFDIPSGLLQAGAIGLLNATAANFTPQPQFQFQPPCQ
jgi:hypothetical protein